MFDQAAKSFTRYVPNESRGNVVFPCFWHLIINIPL